MNRHVFAIDPGSESSGFAVWDGSLVLSSGVLDNADILSALGRVPSETGIVAIEQIGHYGSGMPAGRDVFDTCIWIGRFIQKRAEVHAPECVLVMRAKIKAHFCGTARAKDPNVRQALIDRLGPKGTKRSPGPTFGVNTHAWQALALAVYVNDQRVPDVKEV